MRVCTALLCKPDSLAHVNKVLMCMHNTFFDWKQLFFTIFSPTPTIVFLVVVQSFDRAMNHLDKAFGFVSSSHQYISRKVGGSLTSCLCCLALCHVVSCCPVLRGIAPRCVVWICLELFWVVLC